MTMIRVKNALYLHIDTGKLMDLMEISLLLYDLFLFFFDFHIPFLSTHTI